MNLGRTETGYCCYCDLLPGWIVTGSDDFKKFQKEVQESLDFYVECAKADGEDYPNILDEEYEVIYNPIKD